MSESDSQAGIPPAGSGMAPAFRLYSPGQIAAATFLGSPVAGCWLMGTNHMALGSEDEARRTRMLGFLATIVAIGLAFVLPKQVPNVVLPAGYTAAMYQVASSRQGSRFKEHLSAGGRRHSHWRVAGIGLAFGVGVLIVVIALVLVLPENTFPK